MWGVSRLPPSPGLDFSGHRLIAGLVFLLGLACALAGVIGFRRAATTVNPTAPEQSSAIVQSGIYQYSRNPMYLGFLMALAAWALLLSHIVAFLLLPGFIAYMNRFQILPEERALLGKFGADFSAYKTSVRRWL